MRPRACTHQWVRQNHLGDLRPGGGGEEENNVAHLAVLVDLADHLAAVGFQRAAVVVQPHSGDFGNEPVGDY